VSGQRLVALFAPPEPEHRLVAYFHGNGEELGDLSPLATTLVKRGVGVLFVEYPGYGRAAGGEATEENLYAVADAALLGLQARGIGGRRVSQAIPGAELEIFAGGEHYDLWRREDGRLVGMIIDQAMVR
jgi:hypothetical protein